MYLFLKSSSFNRYHIVCLHPMKLTAEIAGLPALIEHPLWVAPTMPILCPERTIIVVVPADAAVAG